MKNFKEFVTENVDRVYIARYQDEGHVTFWAIQNTFKDYAATIEGNGWQSSILGSLEGIPKNVGHAEYYSDAMFYSDNIKNLIYTILILPEFIVWDNSDYVNVLESLPPEDEFKQAYLQVKSELVRNGLNSIGYEDPEDDTSAL